MTPEKEITTWQQVACILKNGDQELQETLKAELKILLELTNLKRQKMASSLAAFLILAS